MSIRAVDDEIEPLLADLNRAWKTLEAEQGKLARSNARKRVKAVLKRIEGAMDRKYPTIRASREGVKRVIKHPGALTQSRHAWLAKNKLVQVHPRHVYVQQVRQAGVRGRTYRGIYAIPQWAYDLCSDHPERYEDVKLIRELCRVNNMSPRERQAYLVMKTLST